jgi:chemotaxis protein methyltransferase CheR
MKELLGDKFDFEIFASDIDTKCLNRVAKGIYSLDSVSPISKNLVNKYFQVGKGKAAGYVKVVDSLKKHIKIDRVNLIEPFKITTKFDIVFCRNVMIYFDIPTKQNIVNKFYNLMTSDSYLMIGHSESLNGFEHPFKYVQPAVYKKEN